PANMDSIQILRASACIDQAGGRGAGFLYSGTGSTYPNGGSPEQSSAQMLSPTYAWSNPFTGRTTCIGGGPCGITSNTGRTIRGREFYYEDTNQAAQSNANSPFDGTNTLGIGHGTLATRPSTCTPGVAYWATDQGEWDSTHSGPDGQLYKCTAANTWT